MRILDIVSIAICLSFVTASGQGPTVEGQGSAGLRKVPRHFSERPPVAFELDLASERGPRFIVTNLYQEPLTAFIVQTEPNSERDLRQTLPWDAFDRGWSPIPRGLSVVESLPRIVGGPIPNAKLVAAVWDDGSTYGPDEMIQRIYANRAALADAFDRALHFLQAGIERGWTREQYLASVEREVKPQGGHPGLSAADTERAAMIPARLIKSNLQGGMTVDGKPAPTEFAVKKLIEICRQRRDSLTPSKPIAER